MFELDPVTGSIELPIWASASLAAVLVALAVLAFARAGALRTLGAVAILALVGGVGWLGWNAMQHNGGAGIVASAGPDDRRDFDRRVTELLGRAMAPGSALSCLDGTAGEQVAIGCEKLIFSGPETISTAVTYVSARLTLLAEGAELARHGTAAAYEPSLSALRRGLETDRFGIVAYLLLQQPNCTVESCASLAMFRDANRVRANLTDRPFDVLVTRYSANWQLTGRGAETAATSAIPSGPAPANAPPPGTPMSSKYDFPSSDSIPAVSIMSPEPPSAKAAAAKPAPADQKEAPAKPATAEAKPAAKKPAPRRAPEHAAAARSAQPTPLAPAAAAAQ